MTGLRILMAMIGIGLLVACAPFRGGEQSGYWQHVTKEARK
jgi:hypothetical protein